jgi:hypothetical protein
MIYKEELKQGLEVIRQLEVSIATEQRKIKEGTYNIKEIEAELKLRRDTMASLQETMLKKCSELHELIYAQLPSRYDRKEKKE